MFYVLDENNNKVEALDKEGVLALLETAIENGDLQNVASDSAFVDKLKCCVTGGTNYVAFITQAKYNELVANNQLKANAIYYITDDTTCEDIDTQLDSLNESINSLDTRITKIENSINRLPIMYISTNPDLMGEGFDLSSYLTTIGRKKTIGISADTRVNFSDNTWAELYFSTLWCAAISDTITNTSSYVNTTFSNGSNVYYITFFIEIDRNTNILKAKFVSAFSITNNEVKVVSSIKLVNLNIYF